MHDEVINLQTDQKLTYKDESGQTLYGYSQTNMDELVTHYRHLKWVMVLFLVLGVIIVAMIAFVLWYVLEHRVVSNIVNACIK